MSEPARHSVSVAAVVPDDQGRVLVIRRRDNGAWQLPGGVLELHETIEDGLRREVEEETGVKVEPVRLTGVYKNMKLGVVALVFLARPVGGTRARPRIPCGRLVDHRPCVGRDDQKPSLFASSTRCKPDRKRQPSSHDGVQIAH